jgi:integration host factor subunit alpha
MTKADIIEGVYEKVGFSKKESAEIVELVFDTLKETLERGDKIKISGFGNFQVRQKKARVGRNPQTGKEIEISARRVLTFRPSQVLKSALNGEAPPENHAEIDAREEENDENDDFDSEDMDSEDMDGEGAEGGKY